VELRGSLQEYAVLRIGPDGGCTMRGIPNLETALARDDAPGAQPLEE